MSIPEYEGNDPLLSLPGRMLNTEMMIEVQMLAVLFPRQSEDFPKSDQRGNVNGRLLIRDSISDDYISADGAYVGLAPLGDVGSWQRECKDYQFWTKADEDGYFSINDIRTGDYTLNAWVPGFIGDYQYDVVITITSGCEVDMGDLVYKPPRDGPTLWEIGIPDRSAAEFYVPDPNPSYVNKLFVNHPDRFRQYGLWDRYTELYPDTDLVYTVGVSDYSKDWFFAQVTRKKDENKYQGTTWQIKFTLDNVDQNGSYKLRLALASATLSELQVRVNNPKANPPLFTSGLIGKDNSIARHGIHGLYWLYKVVIDNGILQVNLSKPEGMVVGIQYQGIDNLLEVLQDETNRGYWDLVWSAPGITRKKGAFDRIEGTNFTVIVETEDQIELSFTRMWDPSLEGKMVPLNIDKRFVLLSNSSGFYTYAIYEHLKEWPAFNLTNTRTVFKLRKDKFHYMQCQTTGKDTCPFPMIGRQNEGKPWLTRGSLARHPSSRSFKGEWMTSISIRLRTYIIGCMDGYQMTHRWEFWQITPSEEFKSGGPLKQCLTSHVGPTTLAIFHSTHYSGEELIIQFGSNEPWKKVFGPVYFYLNSLVDGADPIQQLWEDAKQQMNNEVQSWPYYFPASKDFLSPNQRGTVSGRLLVCYDDKDVPGNGTLVGVAAPGDVGSWQLECKGYQYWTKADNNGCFSIHGVRPGTYNLYAWVPGCDVDVGTLVYEPPRTGPTLWEIGVPDRTAAEFYIPDPNPKYINKLYVNHTERFRQYGLWERYADLYPDNDLIYTPSALAIIERFLLRSGYQEDR
ncbi:hypothetical protein M0R45_027179 [Rubus argutus]|uniref:Rhamnogalacturonan endolyase n=1 Tax=Rubus argutus TaxID=59490 RepID=A0AAW1X132_RUBAR